MNRKDTIIIAVLINAGLLALLFMMAINTDDEKIRDHSDMNHALVENQPIQPVVQQMNPEPVPISTVLADASSADEVDNFLKDLTSAENFSQSALLDEEGLIELESYAAPAAANPIAQEESKASADTRFVEVTVKRGDALEKIARSNGTTIEAIKKANNMTSSKLSIGQVLKVPVAEKSVAKKSANASKPSSAVASTTKAPEAKAPEAKASASNDPQYYTIKSGDNPWKIARQFQVKFDDLLKLNGLDEEKARNLKVGDKIRVK